MINVRRITSCIVDCLCKLSDGFINNLWGWRNTLVGLRSIITIERTSVLENFNWWSILSRLVNILGRCVQTGR